MTPSQRSLGHNWLQSPGTHWLASITGNRTSTLGGMGGSTYGATWHDEADWPRCSALVGGVDLERPTLSGVGGRP